VVPKLTTLFTETGQLLPLPTRILLGVSGALSHGWWAVILGLIASGWGLQRFRRSETGSAVWDRLVLRVPLAGSLTRKLQTARFTRNLGVMIGQGVPMLQALDVAKATVSNAVLRQAVAGISDDVRQGSSLSRALSAGQEFPAFVSNMVAVGEESGTLETALLKVAAAYERETDRALRALTTVLEPVLIVAVGVVVAVVEMVVVVMGM
jgi:type II secretory pathway component PulF